MTISLFAFAAAVAAQAAAPQASVQTAAPAQEPMTEAQARAQGIAEGRALTQSSETQSQSFAASASQGKILWHDIASGMSVAQLHALYPQGSHVDYKGDRMVLTDVPIIEGCNAKVNVMHASGAVQEIVMRGEGAIAGRCSLKIITALSGKYGEPLDKDKVRGSLFARQGKNYIWTHDGVTLQLKRYTSGALGGGGLFAASWELRYSAAASDIDL